MQPLLTYIEERKERSEKGEGPLGGTGGGTGGGTEGPLVVNPLEW